MSYKVKLDIFEGPFDLLVYLIEQQGVSIYDVNLTEITGQYLEHVHQLEQVEPESAAEFMELAATLIRIKSKMLLPKRKETESEPEADPRAELEERILEYRRIRSLAEKMRVLEKEGARFFTKPAEDLSGYMDSPVEQLNLDPEKLMTAFRRFLERKKTTEDVRNRYQRARRETMTMEQKLTRIDRLLLPDRELPFSDLIGDMRDTWDIVLTFSAILELLRAGQVLARQPEPYGEIYLYRRERKESGEDAYAG